jgi:predicted transcriptional regulator
MKTGLANVVRVRDVMTTEVVHVDADATVMDAADVLSKHKIGGAPVLKSGRLVGMVSKSDLVDPRNEWEARVDRVMTRVAYGVRQSDPLALAVQLIVDENIHRALVVDDEGVVVGIVTPIDVLRAMRNGEFASEERVDVAYVDLRRLGI